MMISKESKYLINKSSIDMSLDEWIDYMNSCDIIEHNLDTIKFPLLKNYSNVSRFKDIYPTFSNFIKRLEEYFSKKWIKKNKILFKNFYEKRKNDLVKKWWFDSELITSIINKSYHKKFTNNELIFYIRKGYNKMESKCLLSKHFLESSPMRVAFWIKRGLTESEAIKKISQMASSATKGSFKYWMKKGYDYEEANKLSKEHIKSLISSSHYNYFKYKNLSEDQKKKKIQKIMKEKSPASYQYWMKKGYKKKEAIEKAKEYLWKINPMNIEKYLNDGISLKDAKKIIRKQSKYMSSHLNPKGGRYAKLFFENLEKEIIFQKIPYKELYYGYKNFEYPILINPTSLFYTMRKKIFLDFYIVLQNNYKINIEYDHPYYHKNKELDHQRDQYLLKYCDIHVIRISYNNFGKGNVDYSIFKKICNQIRINYENYKN